ncbi:HlyD family efflux transporter periplasmic adaptor subunit, partial [Paenibacillus popilliae]
NYSNDSYFKVMQEIEQSEYQLAEQSKELEELIVEFNHTIQQKEATWKEGKEKLKELDQSIQDREVMAPVHGIINVSKEMNRGELLQTGEEILTIIPDNGAEFVVNMAVTNQDIALIQVGDFIRCNVPALPAHNYGHFTGRVEMISEDAIIDPKSGASYYRVQASLFPKPLYNEQGETAQIKNGMLAEAHIVTHREKILDYILDKLDLQ